MNRTQSIKKTFFFSLSLIFLLVACSKKEISTKSHLTSLDRSFSDNVVLSWKLEEATQERLDAVNENLTYLNQIISEVNDFISANSLHLSNLDKKRIAVDEQVEKMDKVFHELKDIALNPNYYDNEILKGKNEFIEIFHSFHDVFVALINLSPKHVEDRGYYEAYWKMASTGCSEKKLQGCRLARFLKHFTSRTSTILESYAWFLDRQVKALKKEKSGASFNEEKYLSLVKRKIDAITLAYFMQVASQSRNGDLLTVLYLTSQNEFNELPEEVYGEMHRDMLVGINNTFIKSLPEKLKSKNFRDRYFTYFKESNVFRNITFHSNERIIKEFGGSEAVTNLFRVACEFFGDSDFAKDSIRQSLNDVDASNEKGFLRIVREMQQEPSNRAILKNLDMDMNFSGADEYLFIIDQLYRGHWTSEVASTCWKVKKRTSQEEEKFLNTLEKYVKVELVRKIIMTNSYMGSVFSPGEGGESISSSRLFWRAIEKSKTLTQPWIDTLKKFDLLHSFTQANVIGSNNDGLRASKYKRVDSIFKNVRRNIKSLVVYPNMLVMCYYLAVKEFSVKIRTFWGNFYLTPELIINWLFTANEVSPWFNFGNDGKGLKAYENFYSLFYALKTGIFETFSKIEKSLTLSEKEVDSGAKKIKISKENFIATVIYRYLREEVDEYKISIKSLEQAYVDSDSSYKREKDICNILKEGKAPNYGLSTSFKDFRDETFIAPEKISKFYAESPQHSPYRLMNGFRDKIYRKVLFLNTMIEILDDHWRLESGLDLDKSVPENQASSQMDPEVEKYLLVQKRTKELRKNYRFLWSMVRRSHNFILSRHRELDGCMHAIMKKETSQRYALIRKEEEYLYSVHAGLKYMHDELKKLPVDTEEQKRHYEAERERLEVTLSNAVNSVKTPLGSGYSPLAYPVGHPFYVVAKLSKTYLQELGDSYIENRREKQQGHGKISAISGFTYSGWNTLLRMRHNVREINPSIQVKVPTVRLEDEWHYSNGSSDKFSESIVFQENANEFVSQALSALSRKEYVRWFNDSIYSYQRSYKSKIDLMVSLYKNQQIGIFDEAYSGCKENQSEEFCKEAKSIKPISMDEIVDEVFKVAELFNINKEDEHILRLLNKPLKNNKRASLKGLFLNGKDEPISLLEFVYESFSKDKTLLGEAKEAVNTFSSMLSGDAFTDKTEGGLSWDEKLSDELIFLADKDTVRKNMRMIYRPVVLSTIKMVEDLQKLAYCRGQRDKDKSNEELSYRYEIDLNSTTDDGLRFGIYEDSHRRLDNSPIYIREKLINDFHSDVIIDLQKVVRNIFDAQEGEVDGFALDNRPSEWDFDCSQQENIK